jgi:hypothetical protein
MLFAFFLVLFQYKPVLSSQGPRNTYNFFLQEYFLGRQPSAKAEAMGRGLVAYPEYEYSSWYNPATIGLSETFTANGSYASPYYYLDSAHYDYLGVTHNTGKYGAIGFSRYYMSEGLNYVFTDPNDDIKTTLYTLNYACQPVKDLYAGVNFNVLSIHIPDIIGNPGGSSQTLYPIDIGMMQIFRIQETKNTIQKITLGSSLFNLNNVQYTAMDVNQSESLPVILRLGASYNFQYTQRISQSHELRTLNLMSHIEIEDVLNSRYCTVIKGGLDLSFLEIFSLRLGYFSQNLNSENYPGNLSEQHQITYGFGLQIPLTKITKGNLPLRIKFDYTSLEQPAYANGTDFRNYNSLSISLRWDNPLYKF